MRRRGFKAFANALGSFASSGRDTISDQKAKRRHTSCHFEQLEPRMVLSTTPLITEFMASNDTTLANGDGGFTDWIEVHNPTAQTIDLAGWHLTDNDTDLNKWQFPNLPQSVLSPGEYLVVFASGQNVDDYVDAGGNMHTNFGLSAGGEYLALTDPAENIIYEYAPTYPQQTTDIAFGIDPNDSPFGLGFFTTPTPGAANSTPSVVEKVILSHNSQTFSGSFQLSLSGTTGPGQTIHYTLDGSVPTSSSPTYTSPITINGTKQVRANIHEVGKSVGPTTTGNYSRLGADVLAFESQLPILLIENFGGGSVPAKGWNQTGAGIHQVPRQSSAVTVFSNSDGTASLQGETDINSRSGIRVRGAFSSTFPEPQYSLETWGEEDDDLDVDVFGMAPESDWILYSPNPTYDQTLMNNQFMFGLAYPTTVWAPQVQYVEAFLNTDGGDVTMADYVGLYVWTERVKRDPGRLDFEQFASDGSSGGWLLSINRMDAIPEDDPTATPQFFHTPGPNGILQTPPNTAGVGDDIPRQGNAFINFEHPNGYDLNPTQRQAIEDWFADMEDVLYGRTPVAWNDPVDGYAKYIDVDNFVDYYILHNLSRNSDGLLLSMWIYNPDPNNGGKLKFGPPWDHDLGSFEGNPSSDLLHRSDRLWYARLFQDAAFRQRYQDRWQMWRQSILSDAGMYQVFDDFVADIGNEAAVRDGVTNLNSRIGAVKSWLSQRAAAIDAQFLQPPMLNQNGGEVAAGFSAFLSTNFGDIYYTTNGTDPRLPDGNVNPSAFFHEGGADNGTLIAPGSVWNYLDDGSNQGTAWKEVGFNDSTWASGQAQLGYGDGDESPTGVVGFVDADPNTPGIQKNITTYFRTTFDVEDTNAFTDLTLRILRDDGAVVYINGTEVERPNMPGRVGEAGTIDYQTPALNAVGGSEETTQFFTFFLDPAVLVTGENTIAVEIHQAGPDSSDISFDLELLGTRATGTPITLNQSTTITARTRNGGLWSAPLIADFFVDAKQASAANLRISELNYNPYAAQTQFGEPDVDNELFEFIELVNIDPTNTIDLKGVAFAAGVDFSFDRFTPLLPGQRVLVVHDQAAVEARYNNRLNIAGTFQNSTSLANGQELIRLEAADGGLITEFTYSGGGIWPGRADGKGATLEAIDFTGDYNDPENWRSSNEFGGTPGTVGTGPVFDVVINEVLSNGAGGALDKIEIYNTTSTPIDLGGWHLSESTDDYFQYTFTAGTMLPAGGYLVVDESQLGFALDGTLGEDVWLLQGNPSQNGRLMRFADHVDFDASDVDMAWGRVPNGNPSAQGASIFPMTSQTFGVANTSFVNSNVLLSEVMFDPAPVPAPHVGVIDLDELEFVELVNTTLAPIDIGSWRFRQTEGGMFTLPAGITLAADETALIVGFDPALEPAKTAAFRAIYNLDSSIQLVGPYGGKLRNEGESLSLLRPADPSMLATTGYVLVDRVGYDEAAPWPTSLSGTGNSLHRSSAATFGNFASSWHGAVASPGSVELMTSLPGDFDSNNVVDEGDLTSWEAGWGTSSGALTTDGDADQDGDVDGADFLTWQRHYGSSSLAAMSVTVEPVSAALTADQSNEVTAQQQATVIDPTTQLMQAAILLDTQDMHSSAPNTSATDEVFRNLANLESSEPFNTYVFYSARHNSTLAKVFSTFGGKRPDHRLHALADRLLADFLTDADEGLGG